jgi:hypothetical protein
MVFLCCPARKKKTHLLTLVLSTFFSQKLFPKYTLPENNKGRKRRTTKDEEGAEEEEALEALEAATRNQKSEQSREREREILTLSLKLSISKSIFFLCLQQV